MNLDNKACPKGPVVLRPDQLQFSCGGFDGRPWLIAGVIAIGLAALLYRRLSRPAPPPRHATSSTHTAGP